MLHQEQSKSDRDFRKRRTHARDTTVTFNMGRFFVFWNRILLKPTTSQDSFPSLISLLKPALTASLHIHPSHPTPSPQAFSLLQASQLPNHLHPSHTPPNSLNAPSTAPPPSLRPIISTKKIYCQGLAPLAGLVLILVKFKSFFLNTARESARAPGLVWEIVKDMRVL